MLITKSIEFIKLTIFEVFGGIDVYMIGDFKQLPPVMNHPNYSTKPKTESKSKGYHAITQFQKVIITESMWQTDEHCR